MADPYRELHAGEGEVAVAASKSPEVQGNLLPLFGSVAAGMSPLGNLGGMAEMPVIDDDEIERQVTQRMMRHRMKRLRAMQK